ncbi:hypothetical protein G9A89_019162 [Geosiphon pyriformis]|nr:hypothetical protein G9A89_019162 [Geosiphon pyriformis]
MSTSDSKKRINYFYDDKIGDYSHGPGHPMKPMRVKMTHSLVMSYGLYKKMEIYRPRPGTIEELTQFHTDEYIKFLGKVTPANFDDYYQDQVKFSVGDDCPVFDGLLEYCQITAGGSLEGAARLNHNLCDIAVNWAGGLHHAKMQEASGFCYVNDIVIAIIELLRYHPRVLYIDIDVHHGDGVEEAFYTTDRVMTLSFHNYGDFFPGTGDINDIGYGKGKYYAVNVPLRDGIDDTTYKTIFEPVVTHVIEWYQPSVIVLQCGADSLSGDRLGTFNLSTIGHGECVRFVKKFNIPMLVLGGGGYTIRNVPRCWAYETAIIVDKDVPMELPHNEFYEYFGPEYTLHTTPSNMENMNSPDYLEAAKLKIFENLDRSRHTPSVQMQDVPRDRYMLEDYDEDLEDPDNRRTQRSWDKRIVPDNEYEDSDDEEQESNSRRGRVPYIRTYRYKFLSGQAKLQAANTSASAVAADTIMGDAERSSSADAVVPPIPPSPQTMAPGIQAEEEKEDDNDMDDVIEEVLEATDMQVDSSFNPHSVALYPIEETNGVPTSFSSSSSSSLSSSPSLLSPIPTAESDLVAVNTENTTSTSTTPPPQSLSTSPPPTPVVSATTTSSTTVLTTDIVTTTVTTTTTSPSNIIP